MGRIVSILGIFAAFLASVGSALSAELAANHRAAAYSQHCCWDVPWNIQIVNGSGPVAANSWSAGATAGSTPGFGVLEGVATAVAHNRGFTYSDGIGTISDGWADSLTFHSSSLAIGTPIQYRLNVFLDYDYSLTRMDAGVASFRAKAAFLSDGTGLDALDATSWQTGTIFELSTSETGTGSGHREASTLRNSAIGNTVDLRGYMNLMTESFIDSSALGHVDSVLHGRAFYTVDILTPGAGFDSRSGAAYVLAAVPEPETYAMLLAGLGLLGVTAGRRRSRRNN